MSRGAEHTKVNKSWSLILFAIGLNSLILYILMDELIFLLVGGVAFLITSLLGLKAYVDSRSANNNSNITKPYQSSLLDSISLVRKYIYINKKYTLASIIGLLLAILVISQVMIVSNSFQQSSFENYIEGNDTTLYRIEIDNVDNNTAKEWQSYLEANQEKWLKSGDFDLVSSETYGNFVFKIMLGDRFNFDAASRWMDYLTSETMQWTRENYDFLSQFPTFPDFEYSPDDSLLIIPHTLIYARPEIGTVSYEVSNFTTDLGDVSEFDVLVDFSLQQPVFDSSIPFGNTTWQANRVWKLTDKDLGYIKNNDLAVPFKTFRGNLFLPKSSEWPLLDDLQQTAFDLNKENYIWGDIGVTSVIHTKLPTILEKSFADINVAISELKNRVSIEVSDYFDDPQIEPHLSGFTIINVVSSPLGEIVKNYLSGAPNLDRLMRISTAPLILVSLFLLVFSLSLIEKRKETLFSQMKMRGSSLNQIRLMMIGEILTAAVIASVIGMLLSIPISSFFLKSSGILQFDGEAIDLMIVPDWYWKLPLLGILLALDFNLISLNNVSRLKIEEVLASTGDSQPFWSKINLDLNLFFVSVFYWFVVLNVQLDKTQTQLLFSTIGPIVLAITILGFPMVVGRYFITFLERILNSLKLKFDMVGLAIKNIKTHKHFTSQLMALLLTGMMLAFMGLVMTETMTTVSEERAQYSLGSEIFVENVDITSYDHLVKLHAPGVEIVSVSKTIDYKPDRYELLPGQTVDDAISYHFLGLDTSNYAQTGFWQNNYADKSLDDLMKSIKDEGNMLLQKGYAEALNIEIGETFQLNYDFGGSRGFDFYLNATVDYFPRFITDFPKIDSNGLFELDDVFIITNMATIKLLEEELSSDKITTGAYIRLFDDADVAWVAEQLDSRFADVAEVKIITFESEIISFLQSVDDQGELASEENEFLIIALHSILLITFIVNIMGVSYFAFVFIADRKKEIGIYRALGMTKSQIIKLLFYEIMIIVLISIVFGLIAGGFISFITFQVIVGGGFQLIPPFAIFFPVFLIVAISVVMMIIAMTIAFIPAYINTNKQTGSILRSP
ncbi:MAG: FtsX-like permease family protein [Candidatus Heimdallarchaeota archaeon]|nr:FtsX-like permease family protein [Candidatus Heimdallarchaeota archaeon]